jgi:outer membrane protein TolC
MMSHPKRPFLIKLTLSATLAFAPLCYAEPALTEAWTLSRILSQAEHTNSELKALAHDVLRAEGLSKQSGRWDNPEASISYGPMKQKGSNGHSLDVSLKQKIPFFGQKGVSEKIGEQNKNTIQIESNMRMLSIKHDIIRTVFQFAAMIEEAKHITHRREKIKLIVKYMQSRPFASPSQKADKLLVLNRLRDIEAKFLDIYESKEKYWQKLNIFLQQKNPITLHVSWKNKPEIPNRDNLWNRFQSENYELKKQESLIKLASLSIDQASKKVFPDISVGIGYNEQTVEKHQQTYSGILDFSLPIGDRGTYEKKAALAQKEAESYRLEQRKRDLAAQFDQSWTSLIQSTKRIELYPPELVNELENQLEQVEMNWKKGLVSVVTFLELENQVHEQALKIYESQISYIEALSQILLLAGSEFKNEDINDVK